MGMLSPQHRFCVCKRGHILVDYPTKKIQYRRIWELANKAVDAYILAGLQVGKTAKEKKEPSYANQQNVLEFIIKNRKQAPA